MGRRPRPSGRSPSRLSRSSRSRSPRDVGVLIAAAGAGERAGPGELKQFRCIAGVPMLLRAVRPFARHPRVGQIVVALPAAYAERPPAWLGEVAGERLRLVAGGATRAWSVRAALEALEPGSAIVLIHDAARPFVPAEILDAVIAAAARGVGAVPAVPVTDTLKCAEDGTARVRETVDRRGLWHAQTPQGFPRSVLEAALGTADLDTATDEAALVEAAGHAVELVPGRTSNFKVTTPEDFFLAEAMATS